tara:strand:+ start:1359 stop:1775 length:417 start_codon:yes stop_codon:yes gene_type:complete
MSFGSRGVLVEVMNMPTRTSGRESGLYMGPHQKYRNQHITTQALHGAPYQSNPNVATTVTVARISQRSGGGTNTDVHASSRDQGLVGAAPVHTRAIRGQVPQIKRRRKNDALRSIGVGTTNRTDLGGRQHQRRDVDSG